ncbi:hypothetical protein NUSPORA_01394 [Nucleospora cyclopteri]
MELTNRDKSTKAEKPPASNEQGSKNKSSLIVNEVEKEVKMGKNEKGLPKKSLNTEPEKGITKESLNDHKTDILKEIEEATSATALLSLLKSSSSPADQFLICSKLRFVPIIEFIPYICDIMVEINSDSIYELLRYKSRNLRFRLILFFYTKNLLTQVEDVTQAAFCYYLCCDLYDIEIKFAKKNLNTLYEKVIKRNIPKRMKILNFLCKSRGFIKAHNKFPSFPGIFISLFRSVSILSSSVFNKANAVLSNYIKKRNLRNISTKSNLIFRRNLRYYYELTKVCDRLIELPKMMRQRYLIVELEAFNKNASLENGPNNYIIDLMTGKYLNKIHVTSALALDSKANGPFMVNSMVYKRKNAVRGDFVDTSSLGKIRTLLAQFNTVKEIDDIGDLNGVRNNILVAIEQIVLKEIVERENEIMKRGELEKVGNLITDGGIKNNQPIFKKCLPLKLLETTSNTRISSFIVKNGSIMREEYLAYRIITQIKGIFQLENIPIYLKNYKIIIITEDTGLVETVKNSMSIHKIKSAYKNLKEYFVENFYINEPEKTGEGVKINPVAVENFLNSLVGYSLIQYLLSLKDRHNANILIDEYGHMVHIDFGYILGKHPGVYLVETSPFKFSSEYLDLVELEDFKKLFLEGFKILYKHRDLLPEVKDKLDIEEDQIESFCENLITRSVGNFLTVVYDQFQYYQNGYR